LSLKLGILAGEASGDNLGAGLMRALSEQSGERVQFVGVGGERMIAAGLDSLAPIELLQVNGFREPLARLPALVRLMRRLTRALVAADVDAFIGVDFNVFNFLLESALRKRGLATVHYVSPSVYAWRSGRTRRVEKSADVLLCLYPFEPAFYTGLHVDARFVGHPLADAIDPSMSAAPARAAARAKLSVADASQVLAVLPGSRRSEVALMIDGFLDAAARFCATHPGTAVVIPCLRKTLRDEVQRAVQRHPDLPVTVYDGDARLPLTACDIALVKSGTSTLEATLLHRPMVVSYRLGWFTYQLARRLVRSPFVALPNILAGRELVPELLQDAATPAALAAALTAELHKSRSDADAEAPFVALHEQLRQGADANAAAAVLRLVAQRHP